ncbi:MAG: ATP-grasp domain-containing protein [Spirulina sp. SIO3F2]|nr:ATP-grasp domain-containing protein [Spirulina sp. SIO3F2]
MNSKSSNALDLILLEDTIWLLVGEVNAPNYDFALSEMLACRHPWQRDEVVNAIARFGAISNYDQIYQELLDNGIRLIHSPEQHRLASELPQWYLLLADLTPKSHWFVEPPAFDELAATFGVPFFLKGSRQTSRHQAALSIIQSRGDYEQAIAAYQTDPILHWQNLVCREFVPLRSVPSEPSEKIPPSFEFRTFWWRGKCIGAGQYWSAPHTTTIYHWSPEEEQAALAIAQTAATRLNLPFVAIDVAQTATGDWIVIECSDAQESGYSSISPFTLWQNLVHAEQQVCQVMR